MLDQIHFENCISFSLLSYGKYSNQTTIPTVDEFLSFVKYLKIYFSTYYTKTLQNKQIINHTVPYDIPSIKPNPNSLITQIGGSRQRVLSYIKTLFIRQFGLTIYQHGFYACEVLETVLNILAYAGWAYTVFAPTNTSTFDLSENSVLSIHYVMQQFADPGYAIIRLLPSLDNHLQELTFGHLYQYISRLYTDYQVTPREGISSIAILTKLLVLNAKSYEYLYIRPIVCIFAQIYQPCKQRCRTMTRDYSRQTHYNHRQKTRKNRKQRSKRHKSRSRKK